MLDLKGDGCITYKGVESVSARTLVSKEGGCSPYYGVETVQASMLDLKGGEL